MPSKSSSKSKSNKKSTSKNVVDNVNARAQMDEESLLLTLRCAKEGSIDHITKLSHLVRTFSATQVAETIAMFCTILDQPAFASKQRSPALSPSSRQKVLSALTGLSSIPESMLATQGQSKSPHRSLLEQNWPIIYNAMQYFYREIYKPPQGPEDILKLTKLISGTLPTIVMNFARDDEGFKRMVAQDDMLLNILVRIWLIPGAVFALNPTSRHRFNCHVALGRALYYLDSDSARLARVTHELLCETKWDVGKKIEALVQYSWNPEEACRRSVVSSLASITFLCYLIDGQCIGDSVGLKKFMNKFMTDAALPLVMQWVSFLARDIESASTQRVLREEHLPPMVENTCLLLLASIKSRNGHHWASRFFDLGGLSAIARLLRFAQYKAKKSVGPLAKLFRDILPQYLCHWFVIASAVKAVKVIATNGDVAKFESSLLRDAWMTFEDTLLRRLAIYSACSREYVYSAGRCCANCQIPEEESPLFKCARCKYVLYCSKDCQTTSWKAGGHRSQCELLRKVMSNEGIRMPADNISCIVALAEIRRHLPGLSQYLQSSDNPSGVPLNGALFTVFLKEAPVIQVTSKESLTDDQLRRIRTFNNGNDQGSFFEVMTYFGGKIDELSCTGDRIPADYQWIADGTKYDGDAKIDAELLRRKPARDVNGKNLEFVLDEIDVYVMDARKNFKLPPPGDEESPRTIYDYIEKKVADNFNRVV